MFTKIFDVLYKVVFLPYLSLYLIGVAVALGYGVYRMFMWLNTFDSRILVLLIIGVVWYFAHKKEKKDKEL